mgnify:CR=1 FL=1
MADYIFKHILILNFSLVHLSAQNYQTSPFLSASNSNFQIKSCVLMNFFQTFLYTYSSYSNNANSFYFSSMIFSNFLSTAIFIDQKGVSIENNAYSVNPLNLTTPKNRVHVKDCKFIKCKSVEGIGGGIYYRYNGTEQNSNFQIHKCSFISCSAVSSACFYASGCNINIQYMCAMACFAKYIQIFDCISTSIGLVECQFSQFDQCSTLTNDGESTSLFINSQSINFKLNNHTRCSVRDTACCGYFASGFDLKYTLNSNVNCSGSNYIIFYARHGSHKIDDSLFYMCQKNEAEIWKELCC